jgi:CRP/FNR family transcriptional regulator, cyclic AMP receptor protein
MLIGIYPPTKIAFDSSAAFARGATLASGLVSTFPSAPRISPRSQLISIKAWAKLFTDEQLGRKMRDREAAQEAVLRQGWLSHTPVSFQRAVLDRCLVERFSVGMPVFSVGDEPGGMYGLVAGGLGVSIAPREHGPYTAHFALPGTWFGEGGAFTRQPRRIGLIATRDTQMLHLPLKAIDEIVALDPAAWRWFGLVMIEHLDLAIGGSDDLMIRDHFKRFVAVLLRLGDCRVASPSSDGPIEIDLSHEDIAYMANVARTTAGAILRRLEADGHLGLSYRRINILRPAALRALLAD